MKNSVSNADSFFGDPFAAEIWRTKYAGDYDSPLKYYSDMARTVARGDVEKTAEFLRIMTTKKFSPAGRILAWAGRKKARLSLMNCTTHAIQEDSLESINQASGAIMRASSRGQGIGLDISALRPKGAPVNNAAKSSTGAISFMEMLNSVGSVIGQNGRRGAILFSIDVGHPDVWRPGETDHGGHLPYDFINVKSVPGHVESANISVRISDAFMKAVKGNKNWALSFYSWDSSRPNLSQRLVPARDLFNALGRGAWSSAEPGVLFWDNSQRRSNSDLFGKKWEIVGVNACSEQTLDHEGVCNLGSINLAAYVTDPFTNKAEINMTELLRDVALGVEFLDNVLDIELEDNRSISARQKESIEVLRRVGLGVMGLADALMMLGRDYGDTPETKKFIEYVFSSIQCAAYSASIELAKEKGPALAWEKTEDYRTSIVDKGHFATLPDHIKSEIVKHGTRNVTVMSIAPTGTISNLFGVSSGIEPFFATSYERRHRMNGGWESVLYIPPTVSLGKRMGISEDQWPTAYSISPHDHVRVQAWIQQYIDQSISKTTNFAAGATVEEIQQIYMDAWENGLKGMSVYRDGSRTEQVLSVVNETSEETCSECGGALIHKDGCVSCQNCSFELCEI